MEEAKVQHLIDLGNTILACVQPGGEAERYIDTKLSEAEERWHNLVTQVCVWGGGERCEWVSEWGEGEGEGEIHVQERTMLIQMLFTRIIPRSLQGDGVLDQRESAANKVLINWRAYTDMHRGTQSFVTQMVKMVGTEPLEASGGNTTLLPTYRVCAVTSYTHNVQCTTLESLVLQPFLPSIHPSSLLVPSSIHHPALLAPSTILFPLPSPNLFSIRL